MRIRREYIPMAGVHPDWDNRHCIDDSWIPKRERCSRASVRVRADNIRRGIYDFDAYEDNSALLEMAND